MVTTNNLIQMFAHACKLSLDFTFPIIISQKKHNNDCGAGIGTIVLLNDEGWFVTAGHIISEIIKLHQAKKAYDDLLLKRKAIEDDPNLKKTHKHSQLTGPLKISGDHLTNFSVWIGVPGGSTFDTATVLGGADLAIGKLKNFNKSLIKSYPVFKDPTKAMDSGTSLCKIGFPFHSIKPTFDTTTNNFNFPQGTFPIPLFPIDGIYTRTAQINVIPPTTGGVTAQNNIPILFIETSTPGLLGQSGGPTLDKNGTVWAIQSMTQSYPLGFGSNAKGKGVETEHLKHQYLNVGWGVHAQTLTTFFKQNNVTFKLSDY